MSEQETGTPQPGVLGQSTGTLEIAERETLVAVSLALAEQAVRTLDIVSRHLDPPLYDTEAFVAAVRRLVLDNRHARVRLLLLDSRPLVTQNHRLIELALKLSDFVAIRIPAAQHKQFNEALLIADGMGYVQRTFSDRYEAVASLADRRAATHLADRYEELWTRALPDPNFRKLLL